MGKHFTTVKRTQRDSTTIMEVNIHWTQLGRLTKASLQFLKENFPFSPLSKLIQMKMIVDLELQTKKFLCIMACIHLIHPTLSFTHLTPIIPT